MPNAATGHDFFLCHASRDKPTVDAYAKRLHALGVTTAFDKYDIRAGQDWIERILDLLHLSRICVVFVSKHSSKAIVQGKEVLVARYQARHYPDRHRVIPVYLKGAPPQTDIHGLQTTSGFREMGESPENIAQGLVDELHRMGDAADHATRAIEMIDAVALQWLFPKDHPFRARYELRGDQMVLRERDWEAKTISRDQFESKLKPDDLQLILHLEEKMERLFAEWKENDLDAVTSKAAEKRADEFARRLGNEVVQLLDLLSSAGFQLVDHYGKIRSVVATYHSRRQ